MGEKTPEDRANKEVDKLLAKAIARRKLEVKRHEAKIKKLNKEIEKIKNGELVPDEDEESSSDSFSTTIQKHIIKEKERQQSDDWHGWHDYRKPIKYEPFKNQPMYMVTNKSGPTKNTATKQCEVRSL